MIYTPARPGVAVDRGQPAMILACDACGSFRASGVRAYVVARISNPLSGRPVMADCCLDCRLRDGIVKIQSELVAGWTRAATLYPIPVDWSSPTV